MRLFATRAFLGVQHIWFVDHWHFV